MSEAALLAPPPRSAPIAGLLAALRESAALTGVDIASIADVSPPTVSRWLSGRAFPHPRTQLLLADLRYIAERLAELYTPAEARLWLYSRHCLLDGARPLDAIQAGRAEAVLALIESLADGTFT